jgi:hypothetical protein
MPFSVERNGKWYTLPLDAIPFRYPPGPPNKVILTLDACQFEDASNSAAWIDGEGEFAVFAYCRALTVTRWPTLEEAVEAKRAIDGGGCGGGCVRLHFIIRFDASNPERSEYERQLDEYIALHPECQRGRAESARD